MRAHVMRVFRLRHDTPGTGYKVVVAEADRMLLYLARVCRAARRDARVTVIRISLLAYVDVSTVRRFERATAHSYPDHLDELVGAYAHATNVRPVDIWGAAVRLWLAGVLTGQ